MPYYYTNENGEVAGPVSAKELSQLVESKQLEAKTQICREGTQQWVPISSVVETIKEKTFAGTLQELFQRPLVIACLIAVVLILWKLSSIEHLLDKKATRPQFEYKIKSPDDDKFTTTLDNLGKDGWELVFARRASGENHDMNYECIFKRQIR